MDDLLDPETGEQVNSAYRVEFVEPKADVMAQQQELSERVKSTEFHKQRTCDRAATL